ncbi:MAG: kinase [Pseudomonadales bacterium]|nr:kinase [Pseudomonadales bacterium]
MNFIDQLIEAEQLPAHFRSVVENFYTPLARDIAGLANKPGKPLIVGINGAQGTGKSTLAKFVVAILENTLGKKTAHFSIDDIYLTKAERNALGSKIHPLLATRGVPGTHDMTLGKSIINGLANASKETITRIPVFDKAIDDRLPEAQWRPFQGRPDIIIVEGWCVGSTAQAGSELIEPVNALERNEDALGSWRRYVNCKLAGEYQKFFDCIDLLVFIAAPCWEVILEWRQLQEEKLRLVRSDSGAAAAGIMSPDEVRAFIQHYERITRHNLATLPEKAHFQLNMDRDHQLVSVVQRKAKA